MSDSIIQQMINEKQKKKGWKRIIGCGGCSKSKKQFTKKLMENRKIETDEHN